MISGEIELIYYKELFQNTWNNLYNKINQTWYFVSIHWNTLPS